MLGDLGQCEAERLRRTDVVQPGHHLDGEVPVAVRPALTLDESDPLVEADGVLGQVRLLSELTDAHGILRRA